MAACCVYCNSHSIKHADMHVLFSSPISSIRLTICAMKALYIKGADMNQSMEQGIYQPTTRGAVASFDLQRPIIYLLVSSAVNNQAFTFKGLHSHSLLPMDSSHSFHVVYWTWPTSTNCL